MRERAENRRSISARVKWGSRRKVNVWNVVDYVDGRKLNVRFGVLLLESSLSSLASAG